MPASKAQQAAVAERRSKAIAMRLAGADWDVITERLGYKDRNTACKDIRRALAAHRKEEAAQVEELRQVEALRLDRLQAAHWPKALKGDKPSSEIVLKCIAQRARLQGAEAPARVSVEAQQLGTEILALLTQAGQGDPDEQSDT